MTETDYAKEKLALLKIIMTGIFGAIFALLVYNTQSSGSNFVAVMIVTILLGISLFYLGKEYGKLLDELKDLP